MPPTVNTTAVTINLTCNSIEESVPPYNFALLGGLVAYSNNTSAPFSGFSAEAVGTPQPSCAAFQLNVTDEGYNSTTNVTSIGNWALTFIPRSPTTQDSPFGNNVNTITGNGATGLNGTFALNIGNVKIKNAGSWDWTLMIQINMPGGAIHCFASDPEMDVTP